MNIRRAILILGVLAAPVAYATTPRLFVAGSDGTVPCSLVREDLRARCLVDAPNAFGRAAGVLVLTAFLLVGLRATDRPTDPEGPA